MMLSKRLLIQLTSVSTNPRWVRGFPAGRQRSAHPFHPRPFPTVELRNSTRERGCSNVVCRASGQFAAAEIAASPALRDADFREVGSGARSVGAAGPRADIEEFRTDHAAVRAALS